MSCSTNRSDWDHLYKAVYCKTPECTYPQGGECMGTCALLHRVDTSHLPDDRAAIVIGNTDAASQFYSSREPVMHVEFAGPEPLQMAEWAAGFVAFLMFLLAIVAFNADLFFN